MWSCFFSDTFKKNDEAPVCNQNKTIVSVLTFLRSSLGYVGWGGGGRQMDGGTDKWDRGQVFLIASLLFVLGFLIQLCVDFCDLFVFVLLIASLFFVPGFLIQLRLDFFDIVQSICICASNCCLLFVLGFLIKLCLDFFDIVHRIFYQTRVRSLAMLITHSLTHWLTP